MRRSSLAVFAGLCLAATSMIAAPPERAVDSSQTVAADQGKVRGLTPAEMAMYAAQFRQRPSILRVVTNAKGMVGLTLDESFDHHYVARVNADGSVSFTCSDDPGDVLGFVSQAAPPDTIVRMQRPANRIAAERE